jgi:hypothetical protein
VSAGWVTPAWQANCTFCHGSRTKAFDDASGLNLAAPPEDVAGAAAGAKVGAHAPHLGGAVTSQISCGTCHAVPTPAAPLDHVDGTATVALSGLGGGTYDPAARTCATACHGASGSPAWDSSTPIGCASCHPAPPATGRHPGNEPKHAFMGANCGICHAEVAGVMPQIVGPSRHLNGAVDVKLATGTYDGVGCSTACHATFTRFPWAKP